ncbi:MAG: electron transport complex subunit RsxE [Hydrogenophilales bacterium CG03_land_8_20_14_0_80_62_28]|nr:electron transport complex subunit E [Betaproteobacteria bacterium]OIO79468.1 MAG: electron transport complex subunit RsxE [Hydrogenophilaceae bacterium CG1_02_62_390]PIV24108.1 MAG: electron transport complex subunit RsxE [Hydrogenophilales bacterium CG03_land_8_20_14_0_80_62_28]PIW37466.1 MAG: electron transport complex subunit RsxE [Hydrogenophilales bacterium CG15_BIG_FIL_POST_REV_8_21_14_020_62_31]PIW71519.1 MAG: electron transport complex subunit RsxE [Hydrogenophilales bacterium CG12_
MAIPGQKQLTHLEEFMEGIWKQNPVFVMVLGMCPTLAVSVSAVNSLSMGLATAFVLVCSTLLVSLIRKLVPKEVRIATYIVIIATFVTVVDYLIQAISLTVYEALGAFIQLIVVNCIILGRAEAHASKNPPLRTVINALGMGIGFTIGLFALGSVREILGAGKLFGIPLFGPDFQPWVVMVLPPGGFFVLGAWLLLFNWLDSRKSGVARGEPVEGRVHG